MAGSLGPAARKSEGIPSWLRWAALLVAVVIFVRTLSGRGQGLAEGTVAPQFSLASTKAEGERIDLAALRGKPVLVEVMASWCGYCKRSAPMLAEASQVARKREVAFVAVSMDQTLEEARGAAESWRIPYPVALDDGSFSRAYGVSSLPTVIVIDEVGVVRHVGVGAPSAAGVEAWLADVGAARR